MPNRDGTTPKSRTLNVTRASAWPFRGHAGLTKSSSQMVELRSPSELGRDEAFLEVLHRALGG